MYRNIHIKTMEIQLRKQHSGNVNGGAQHSAAISSLIDSPLSAPLRPIIKNISKLNK